MEYRFEFAPLAMAEADAAHDWIARDSLARAARWYRGLFTRIESLSTHPRRSALAPESEAFGEEVRQLLYGKRRGVYRILFAIRGDVITIFSIRHSARQRLSPDEIRDTEGTGEAHA
jgi:plasmid stabilization system protein ParE